MTHAHPGEELDGRRHHEEASSRSPDTTGQPQLLNLTDPTRPPSPVSAGQCREVLRWAIWRLWAGSAAPTAFTRTGGLLAVRG